MLGETVSKVGGRGINVLIAGAERERTQSCSGTQQDRGEGDLRLGRRVNVRRTGSQDLQSLENGKKVRTS